MDSELLYSKVRAASGIWIDTHLLKESEFPMHSFRSPLSVMTLWFRILPPNLAYHFNEASIHFVAFIGCCLLLSELSKRFLSRDSWLVIIPALCFSFIPFSSAYGWSVAGQPLLILAFWKITEQQGRWYHWAIMAVFPFFSIFAVSGIFLCMAGSLATLWHWWLQKKIPFAAIGAITLFLSSMLFVEHSLVLNSVHPDKPKNHRIEMHRVQSVSECVETLGREYQKIRRYLPYTAGEVPVGGIVVSTFLTILGMAIWNRHSRFLRPLLFFFLMVVLAPVPPFVFRLVQVGLEDWCGAVITYHFAYYFTLIPLSLILCLGLLIAAYESMLKGFARKVGAVVLIVFALAQLWSTIKRDDDLLANAKSLMGIPSEQPSYQEFYSESLFEDVRQLVGDSKVVCLGFHPAIAAWNGLHCIDGYANLYPLSYKHRFRKIMESELSKNSEIRNYFDEWGSRCYLMSAKLGKQFFIRKSSAVTLSDFSLSKDALNDFGVKYLLSAVELQGEASLRYPCIRVFDSPKSALRIYVCQIN